VAQTLIAETYYGSFYEAHDAIYVNAHNMVNADGTLGPSVIVGQLLSIDYFIYRSGLFFDTSSIPVSAIISAATLSLYGIVELPAQDFNLTIINGADLSNPRVASDYGDLLNDIISGGLKDTTGWILNAYNIIPLNATGIGWITLAGITQLALRSSRDINSNVPIFGTSERIRALAVDPTNSARLTVTYTAFPEVQTLPATEIT